MQYCRPAAYESTLCDAGFTRPPRLSTPRNPRRQHWENAKCCGIPRGDRGVGVTWYTSRWCLCVSLWSLALLYKAHKMLVCTVSRGRIVVYTAGSAERVVSKPERRLDSSRRAEATKGFALLSLTQVSRPNPGWINRLPCIITRR